MKIIDRTDQQSSYILYRSILTKQSNKNNIRLSQSLVMFIKILACFQLKKEKRSQYNKSFSNELQLNKLLAAIFFFTVFRTGRDLEQGRRLVRCGQISLNFSLNCFKILCTFILAFFYLNVFKTEGSSQGSRDSLAFKKC